ncbi:MAG TPA: PadR family transcriptional regulator [Ktedonobacteraceae bacterium]
MSLDDTDLMTLLAILRLGEKAYGVSLCQELTSMTGKTAALASVYKTLERLEKRGLVASHMGEPGSERGGRAKRFVRVTQQGLRAIDTTRTLLNSLWQEVPAFGKGLQRRRA